MHTCSLKHATIAGHTASCHASHTPSVSDAADGSRPGGHAGRAGSEGNDTTHCLYTLLEITLRSLKVPGNSVLEIYKIII